MSFNAALTNQATKPGYSTRMTANDLQQRGFLAGVPMDTTWLAVDQDGFIALMYSGIECAVPCAYKGNQGDDGMGFLSELAAHTGRQLEFCETDSVDGQFGEGESERVMPDSVGLYGFSGDEEGCVIDNTDDDGAEIEVVPRYKRLVIPDEPLHVSQLPPSLQLKLEGLVFADVSFSRAEWLQPALSMPCILWLTEESDLLAVDVQGKILPVPEHFNSLVLSDI